MSNLVTRACADKHTTTIETHNEFRMGACGMQGWRKSMEDAHFCDYEIEGITEPHFLLAVFDGHNGGGAARWCAEHLVPTLLKAPGWNTRDFHQALTATFLALDDQLRAESVYDEVGTTACVVLMIGGMVYCANCGDSRAIIITRLAQTLPTAALTDGSSPHPSISIPLSYDHKPSLPSEIARVTAAGGSVTNGRVNGLLSLTRALGDFQLKKLGAPPLENVISPMPDIVSMPWDPSVHWWIVVACDGIWETRDSDHVASTFVRHLRSSNDDMGLAAEGLLDSCLAQIAAGLGTDNMTVVVLEPVWRDSDAAPGAAAAVAHGGASVTGVADPGSSSSTTS